MPLTLLADLAGGGRGALASGEAGTAAVVGQAAGRSRPPTPDPGAALVVQTALTIEILLMQPIRLKNLTQA